ncbi:hypothetical protein C5167_024695 [Papaver somniferum]|uniref:Uncharacterized protein n=1 Tax=Papaver somniferum TaxID=3469 RepID=A0A4Y7JTB9_PAPSO|nr:hypothetical protein C5167_024695 [Papaver somniferum]
MQARDLQSNSTEESNAHPQIPNFQATEEELNSSDDEEDDGLPPLEANTNRNRPAELDPEPDSESD